MAYGGTRGPTSTIRRAPWGITSIIRHIDLDLRPLFTPTVRENGRQAHLVLRGGAQREALLSTLAGQSLTADPPEWPVPTAKCRCARGHRPAPGAPCPSRQARSARRSD